MIPVRKETNRRSKRGATPISALQIDTLNEYYYAQRIGMEKVAKLMGFGTVRVVQNLFATQAQWREWRNNPKNGAVI